MTYSSNGSDSVVYTFPGGSYYEGEMVDNCFQGKGMYYFSNGDVYMGEFQNDMFEGYGEYIYKTGSVYTGYFSKDMFHGIGTWTHQDETVEKGKFHYDKRVGKFYEKKQDSQEVCELLYQNDVCVKSQCVDSETVPVEKLP